MFTGIITDVGRVRRVAETDRDRRYEIETAYDLSGVDIGASIGVASGVVDLFHVGSGLPYLFVAGPTATAQTKFHCPACGAEATWNPAKQALVCAFCNTVSPAQLSEAADAAGIVLDELGSMKRWSPSGRLKKTSPSGPISVLPTMAVRI